MMLKRLLSGADRTSLVAAFYSAQASTFGGVPITQKLSKEHTRSYTRYGNMGFLTEKTLCPVTVYRTWEDAGINADNLLEI